jgi:hypothetical protein
LTKQKALCVATRCTTAEQFIETFHRFCDEQSFFVATMNVRPVGLETPFSIQLADKTPVLRGLCVVLAAWTNHANEYKRPGIRLGIKRLTPESEAVFYQLQAMRTSAPQEVVTESSEAMSETPVPIALTPVVTAPRVAPPSSPRINPPAIPHPPAIPMPRQVTPRAGSVISVPPKATPPELPIFETQTKVDPNPLKHYAAVEEPRAEPVPLPPSPPAPETRGEKIRGLLAAIDERTPGSELVLPANPLSNVTDEAIEGFVDCTLYEETANFFRAPEDEQGDDEPAEPPRTRRSTNLPALAPALPPVDPDAAVAALQAISGEIQDDVPLPLEVMPSTRSRRPTLESLSQQVESLQIAVQKTHSVVEQLPVMPARVTPIPNGEVMARPAPEPARKSSALSWAIAATAIAAAAGLVLVILSRTNSSDDAKPKPQAKAVTEAKVSEPPPPPDKPPVDKAIDDDGEEVAAVNGTDSSAPVQGEGPCKLEIATTPAGTMVAVDGKTIGPSPLTIAGPCTKRRVDLVHPRYKAEMRMVELEESKPSAIDVTLVRPTHSLLVVSNPPGATVYIAGRRAGTTPTKVPLMGFSGLDVKIEKNGFDTVKKRIYSKVPNDKMSVTLKRSLWIKGATSSK